MRWFFTHERVFGCVSEPEQWPHHILIDYMAFKTLNLLDLSTSFIHNLNNPFNIPQIKPMHFIPLPPTWVHQSNNTNWFSNDAICMCSYMFAFEQNQFIAIQSRFIIRIIFFFLHHLLTNSICPTYKFIEVNPQIREKNVR